MAVMRQDVLDSVNDVAFAEFDALEFQSVALQISGTFVGTIAFQVSNDAVAWGTKALVQSTGTIVTTTTAGGLYSADIGARYFRLVMTAYTSGAATVLIEYSKMSQSNNSASQAVSGNVGVTSLTPGTTGTSLGKAEDAVHTSGDVGVMSLGVRNDNSATALSSANGDYTPVATDISGAQWAKTKPALTAAAPAFVTPATTNAQLIAANAARRIGIIQNNSTVAVNIRFGATAATTTAGGYHMTLAAGATYELPSGLNAAVQVIAAAAGTGPVTFTEVTD